LSEVIVRRLFLFEAIHYVSNQCSTVDEMLILIRVFNMQLNFIVGKQIMMSALMQQLSLFLMVIVQLTSSQYTYDVSARENDAGSCESTQQLSMQLLAAVSQLHTGMSQLKDRVSQLQTANSQMVTKMTQLQTSNSQMATKMSQLQSGVSQLQTYNSRLQRDVTGLKTSVARIEVKRKLNLSIHTRIGQ